MPTFVAHDSRLRGSISPPQIRQQGLLYCQYTPANHLTDIVRDFNYDFDRYWSQNQQVPPSERKLDMEIWAHGCVLGRKLATGIGSYDRHIRERRYSGANEQEAQRHYNESFLGYGIVLCWDILSFSTICRLEPLRGKINSLTLNVCGAAHISSDTSELTRAFINGVRLDGSIGSLNTRGNGHEFCSALASRLNCVVYAPTESQYYSADGINWGYREGLWVTYGSDGRLHRNAIRYRSGFVDSNGNGHGNETDYEGREVRLD